MVSRKPVIPRKKTFKCAYCHRELPDLAAETGTGWPGYGYPSYKSKNKVCGECLARGEMKEIARSPPGGKHMFYLGDHNKTVSNWTGLVSFPVAWATFGSHNIGGHRVDVWFRDHTGAWWHGVHAGGMNTVVHAKKLKETPVKPWHATNMRL